MYTCICSPCVYVYDVSICVRQCNGPCVNATGVSKRDLYQSICVASQNESWRRPAATEEDVSRKCLVRWLRLTVDIVMVRRTCTNLTSFERSGPATGVAKARDMGATDLSRGGFGAVRPGVFVREGQRGVVESLCECDTSSATVWAPPIVWHRATDGSQRLSHACLSTNLTRRIKLRMAHYKPHMIS